MGISKKKWASVEKRIADLEVQVQRQQKTISLQEMKGAVKSALQSVAHQELESGHLAINLTSLEPLGKMICKRN